MPKTDSTKPKHCKVCSQTVGELLRLRRLVVQAVPKDTPGGGARCMTSSGSGG